MRNSKRKDASVKQRSTKNILASALILLLALVPTAFAQEPDALVQAAWEANPSIAALDARIEAARQMVPQAGAWKDPMIAIEYSNLPVDSFELGDHPMSGIQFSLQQTLPFPGKNNKREASAEASAEARVWELAERRNQVRRMVKTSFWKLALVRNLKTITTEHVAQVERLIASVRSRYEVGGAGQHDLLRLTVLRDRLADELAEFEVHERELTSTINALLSRSTATPVDTPNKIMVAAPELDAQASYEASLATRPEVFALGQEAQANALAAKSASYSGWPDPTIKLGYRLREEVINDLGMVADEGTDFLSVGIAIPIPIFYGSRWGAMKREKLAAKRAADSKRDSLVDTIRGDLEAAVAGWKRALERAESYSGTIRPGAKSALASTLAAYQVGRADFSSLYSAQVALLDVERVLIKAQAETRLQHARVESLIGAGIPGQGEIK
jgi:outer membrane protein, heavy metal efflux system